MDTQTQIDRLIELAIVQRTELKQLVEQLPQLREHLNAEIEKVFDEVEPQLRAELEEFCDKRAVDANAKVGSALEAKIVELSKALELTTQARYNAIKEQERKVEELRQLAAKQIEGHVAALPEAVKEIVGAELARFPRAGEIDQLRKEFAEPKGLNPRGKWTSDETYNKLDLVSWNGDSFVSNIDGNREKPSRTSEAWTLSAARGIGGGGGGITSLNDVLNAPTTGQIIGSQNGQYVPKTLTAGANITITETANAITIIGDEGQITLQDGTAAAPSLFFQNDPDTGIYRPAANTLGISVSGTQVAYFDQNGLTVPSAGVVAGGSFHGANGNANNPSLSFSGDQDTGFFRHQPNEIGVALGGTQYATLTSTTFSVTPALAVTGAGTFGGNLTVSGGLNLTSSTTNSYIYDGTGWVWTSNGLSSGTVKGGIYTAGGSLFLTANSSLATNRFFLDSSGNATVAGNLTVSGTGVSSVAGKLLLGTTTDSSNGKLQLATHTTSAGGIGFGTDIAFYRSGPATAILETSIGGTGFRFDNGGAGSGNARLLGTYGAMNIASNGANSVFIQTNGTTALTLDSSQNATFAGKLTTGGAYQDISSGLGALNIRSTSAQTAGYGGTILLSGIYTGTSETAFAGIRGAKENSTDNNTAGALSLWTRTAGGALTERLTISSTGNATFTGSVAIGNTVNTVSPTSPNRTITMVINGTTYYIHAKTTND